MAIKANKQIVFVRYWGSFFKSPRAVHDYAVMFRPLIERGWRSYLVLERIPADPSWLKDLNDLGVQILCMPRARSNIDFTCMQRIYILCRRLSCDVFHCDNMHTSPLIGACCAQVPIRVWCKQSMNSCFEKCRTPTFRDKIAATTRLSCALATKVIAISGAVKNELLNLGISEKKITIEINPRRELKKHSVDRAEARRSLGYSDSDIVITTIGHAVPVKGWDILLKAFARIADDCLKVRLLLIGSTCAPSERSFFAKLMQFIELRNLSLRVQFSGHVYDISKMLLAADIFVSPSRSEGGGDALIEALESGLPCIASRVGYAEDIIQHGINGFLVQRNDPDELEHALRTLVDESETRTKFSIDAKLPANIPTMREYAERIASLYESQLNGTSHQSHE